MLRLRLITLRRVRRFSYDLLRFLGHRLGHHHPHLTQAIDGDAVDEAQALVLKQSGNALALQLSFDDLGLQMAICHVNYS